MKEMKHDEVVVRERGSNHDLTPAMIGAERTIQEVVRFFGLEEPDVEWYEIYEVLENGERKLVAGNKDRLQKYRCLQG